jgi:hypothetical protein
MVSSQSLDVPNGPHCDEGSTVVCVIVARAELVTARLHVTGLGVNWYGLTSASIEDAIRDKQQDQIKGWFSPANCTTGHGCLKAIVFVLGADGSSRQREITGP